MTGYPPAALAAAESAIRDRFPGEFSKPGMPEPDALARAALEAAAPLLAEAWGVTARERQQQEARAGSAHYSCVCDHDSWYDPACPCCNRRPVQTTTTPPAG